jgi:Zn-dependent M28 family amino/carboxypeptidase
MESGRKPKRSVMLLAVTAEEKGLVGADYFARNPTVPKGSLVGNVNLDMPILSYDFTDVVAFGGERSTIGEAAARAAERVGVKLVPDHRPEMNLFTRSDHYRFVEQGVPSIFLMTGPGNGGNEAWDRFMAERYHKPSDDMGQPMNFTAAARFARVNYEIARELADAPDRPRWKAGDFFGGVFGSAASRAPARAGSEPRAAR